MKFKYFLKLFHFKIIVSNLIILISRQKRSISNWYIELVHCVTPYNSRSISFETVCSKFFNAFGAVCSELLSFLKMKSPYLSFAVVPFTLKVVSIHFRRLRNNIFNFTSNACFVVEINKFLNFQIFKYHDVIKCTWMKNDQRHFTE